MGRAAGADPAGRGAGRRRLPLAVRAFLRLVPKGTRARRPRRPRGRRRAGPAHLRLLRRRRVLSRWPSPTAGVRTRGSPASPSPPAPSPGRWRCGSSSTASTGTGPGASSASGFACTTVGIGLMQLLVHGADPDLHPRLGHRRVRHRARLLVAVGDGARPRHARRRGRTLVVAPAVRRARRHPRHRRHPAVVELGEDRGLVRRVVARRWPSPITAAVGAVGFVAAPPRRRLDWQLRRICRRSACWKRAVVGGCGRRRRVRGGRAEVARRPAHSGNSPASACHCGCGDPRRRGRARSSVKRPVVGPPGCELHLGEAPQLPGRPAVRR